MGDRFRLGRRVLGAGSGGQTFEAFDLLTGQLVAVKFQYRRTFEGEVTFGELAGELQDEARLLIELADVRGIPDLLGRGTDEDGTYFLAMRKVTGTTLKGYADTGNSPMPVVAAVSAVAQLCEILAEVHGRGFVHRDVKPDNAMIDAAGAVHLIDLGTALRAGGEGRPTGTDGYAPPEQVHERPVHASADVFSLGCMIAELATLRRPYPADYLKSAHREDAVLEPDLSMLPPDLAAVVKAMVAWDPAARPADAAAAFRALQPFLPTPGSAPDHKVLRPDPTAKFRIVPRP